MRKFMMRLIENIIHKITALRKKRRVCKLFVFGSILTNRFNDDSDEELIVSFNKVVVSDYLATTLISNTH